MRGKLIAASFWTLGLLFGMLAAIVLLVLYATGSISVWAVFGLTILINLVSWLFSPTLTDWIQRFFYHTTYYNESQFQNVFPGYAQFLAEECQKNNLPFPKIGFINDDNPTAFSYGSGQWNSRLVFTQGIQTYLEEDEAEAVLAHELGHIAHRDFIVMSIANAIIQLLYEIYYILGRSSGNDRDSKGLALIGWLAYVFYWIGLYIVLFLNRLREYYADEFSAETTGRPDALSRALVKVAYGIMAREDSSKSARLMESTKTMGIMSLQSAKSTALAVKVSNMDPQKVAQVMLFDIVSPWAKLAEISATHPLTGKRLRRLDELAIQDGKTAIYDIDAALETSKLNKRKLWGGFLFGSFMYLLPALIILAALVVTGVASLVFTPTHSLANILLVAGFIVLATLMLLRIIYRYPSLKSADQSNIYTLMTYLYANPVRGYPVQLTGQVVGRGVPGYVFGEDMMMQDNTGLLYLNYEGPFSIISNLVFAIKKFKKFLGENIKAEGWFFRSNTQFLQLKDAQSSDERVKSYPRLYGIIGSVLFAAIMAFVMYAVVANQADNSAVNSANSTYTVSNP
jgi:Zn-dependent protease with chaperone function